MRKSLVAISLLIMFMFLVSCAPQKPLTDEELKAELAKLTPEERAQLLKDLDAKEEGGAFAGQAIRTRPYAQKVSPRIVTVTPQQIQDLAVKDIDIILPSGLTADQVKTFIYAPQTPAAQLKVSSYLVDPLKFQYFHKFDISKAGQLIDEQLKNKVIGYELQVRQNGKPIYSKNYGFAQTPANQNLPWDENIRMNMASVTKFLGAVGLVKLLDSKGIPYNTPIINYLPSYWKKGQNIGKITFADLMTHKSGFVKLVPGAHFSSMRATVAAGVTYPANPSYNNMNFDLIHMMIPIINGDISKDKLFYYANDPNLWDPDYNDKIWDSFTIQYYKNYMQKNIFAPAGITNADFNPNIKHALGYPFPSGNTKGFDSSDCSPWGGHCWVLSTKELLDFLDAVRFKNTIIPAEKAQYMLDNKFGIDVIIDTPTGKIYEKNGYVTNMESIIVFLPNNINIVGYANSPIDLTKVVLDALVASAPKPEQPKPKQETENQKPAKVTLEGVDNTWCFDSDVDLENPTAFNGYCQDNSGTYKDSCQSPVYLYERRCWNYEGKGKAICTYSDYSCNSCSDGACK
ncbi:MAG: serine hydrolase domain-containing protein [Nanoarchaeota archaeon]|nr:serine hydrolase domain-containing protein [Nanoarchaeota archaeon]